MYLAEVSACVSAPRGALSEAGINNALGLEVSQCNEIGRPTPAKKYRRVIREFKHEVLNAATLWGYWSLDWSLDW